MDVEERSNLSSLCSSPSAESIPIRKSTFKEQNYLGLSDCSSVDSSSSLSVNLRATELKLALPGHQSPERERIIDEKHSFLESPKQPAARNKRVFSEGFSSCNTNKAQVVGWPPVPKGMKTTSRGNNEAEGKRAFVKVSMDGAAILRKVDLKAYCAYEELSSGLEKMFSCLADGRYGLKDVVNGWDYVLTYEDKDGDWMLVGDVPWEMFIHCCKKLRIMKSSESIGLCG